MGKDANVYECIQKGKLKWKAPINLIAYWYQCNLIMSIYIAGLFLLLH